MVAGTTSTRVALKDEAVENTLAPRASARMPVSRPVKVLATLRLLGGGGGGNRSLIGTSSEPSSQGTHSAQTIDDTLSPFDIIRDGTGTGAGFPASAAKVAELGAARASARTSCQFHASWRRHCGHIQKLRVLVIRRIPNKIQK